MHRPPRLLIAPVALVAALTLSACGGDDDDDTAATAGDTAATEATAATTTETSATTSGSTTATTTTGTGGGDVGERDEYVEVARDEFASEFEDDDVAECAADALLNDDVFAAIEETGLTLDTFAEDGPTGLGLDDGVAGEIATAMAACGDLLPELFDEDQQPCAQDALTSDQVAEFLAFTLVGATPSDELQDAIAAFETCLAEAPTTT